MANADRKNFDQLTNELLGPHAGFVDAVSRIVRPQAPAVKAAPSAMIPNATTSGSTQKPVKLIEVFCGA